MTGSEGSYRLVLMNNPALIDGHQESCGIYWAACYEDPTVSWSPGVLYESIDGEDYYPVARIDDQATIGVIRKAPSREQPIVGEGWDPDSCYEVEIIGGSGELESVSQENCERGNNMFWMMGEIVGACDARLFDYHKYQISMLLRGQRDTSLYQLFNNRPGGIFVNLSGPGIRFRNLPIASVGTKRWYKAVPSGAAPAEVRAHEIEITGQTLRPFAPFDGQQKKDPAGLIRFSWVPRTRALVRSVAPCSRPVYDDDRFRLEVIDKAGNVVHVEDDYPDRGYTWNKAFQKGEGLTDYKYDVPEDPSALRVSHISEKVGPGRPLIIPVE